eukprot:9663383-Ditylum_brightwellii.AAC.1
MPPNRRYKTPFQKSHALRFAVQSCQRESGSTGLVVSAECLFCVYFGHEKKPGSKCAKTSNTKYCTS